MSLRNIAPQLLMRLSPEGDSSALAIEQPVVIRDFGRGRIAAEVACDWIVVFGVMIGGSLACRSLSIERDLHRSFATIVEISLCVASLIVFLLANDRAYGGAQGPLRIRQVERPIRIAAQASLLVLLLSRAVGAMFPCVPIEICLISAVLWLILEKQAFARFTMGAATTPEAAAQWSAPVRDFSVFAPACNGQDDDLEIAEEIAAKPRPVYEVLKRILEFLLSIAAIVLISPVLLIAAILVALDSPGGIIFAHDRVGKKGRLFRMYKFRSMRGDADPYAVSPTSSTDPRLTRSGSILRKCSIDELPQLWNVIKGEMSLVGPRPEMPTLVKEHHSEHRQRLQVLPGMTGLWQLSPARASRIHENLQYDAYYILNRSLAMDLAILLCTPVRLMRGI